MYIYRRPKVKHLTVYTLSLAVFIVCMSLLKSFGMFRPNFHALEQAVGGAWVMHLVLSTMLSTLLMLSVPARWFHMRWLKLSWVQWFLVMGFCIDEGAQYWIPSRYFSWMDLALNLSGLAIATLLIRMLSRPYAKNGASAKQHSKK